MRIKGITGKIVIIMNMVIALLSCKAQSSHIPGDHKLNLIFVTDTVVAYNGILNSKTKFAKLNYDTTQLKVLIESNREKYADSLEVHIKLTDAMGTAEPLQNIFAFFSGLNKIRFQSDSLTKQEEEFFHTKTFAWEPPEPVEITTPESVNSQALPTNNAFLIEIKTDQSVWYQPLSTTSKMVPQNVKEPIMQNLKMILADYKKLAGDEYRQYLIKGDKDVKYPVFEQVINAMKANDIFNYNLVTSLDQ